MRIEIYVQARMGSTRLPGKVMMPVLGKPLLGYLIERLKRVQGASAIAVLTTTNLLDDVIDTYCKDIGMLCYRGPEEDVLARYRQVAIERKPDAIVRITGDCPLIDPEEVDKAIKVFKDAYPLYDYVSNCIERTYPRGLDTEIFSLGALEHAFQEGTVPYEREHVTPFLYLHPELFSIKNVDSQESLGVHRWTVDTPEDFLLVQTILENVYPDNPKFQMRDVVNFLTQHPEVMKINAHIQQKTLS